MEAQAPQEIITKAKPKDRFKPSALQKALADEMAEDVYNFDWGAVAKKDKLGKRQADS